MTTSEVSASISVILPLPSSPQLAPTIAFTIMCYLRRPGFATAQADLPYPVSNTAPLLYFLFSSRATVFLERNAGEIAFCGDLPRRLFFHPPYGAVPAKKNQTQCVFHSKDRNLQRRRGGRSFVKQRKNS